MQLFFKSTGMDFTTKGGPADVVVKAQVSGDVSFPDGNVWKKL